MPPNLDKIKEFQKELQALLGKYNVSLQASVQVLDLDQRPIIVPEGEIVEDNKKENENLPEVPPTSEEKE